MNYYLGIDGGGTKTDAVLIDENKRIVGKGSTAGSLATVFGMDDSVNRISTAVLQALSGKKLKNIPACLALAGVNTDSDNKQWRQTIRNHLYLSQLLTDPMIVNDTLAALRSGTTDKNAVVVIAGTGSNCYGRDEGGKTAKSGGADHILGDEGSGFDIGSMILHSVTQSLDGRGPKTLLKDLLFDKFKIDSLESLFSLVYKKPWNKVDIASVTPLVEIAAENGDLVAIKIIQKAAYDLGVMIKAVVRKLGLKDKPYTIVTSGSVFKIQTILKDRLKKEILNFSPRVRFVEPSISSAEAAAILALEEKF